MFTYRGVVWSQTRRRRSSLWSIGGPCLLFVGVMSSRGACIYLVHA
jgi:hypothetical protein